MSTISELELIDNLRNKAVQVFEIRLTRQKTYIVRVKLSWKTEKLTLLTARKKIREWVDLERMARYIRTKYGPLPPIRLILNPEQDDDDSTD
jgi:hypothetical protein